MVHMTILLLATATLVSAGFSAVYWFRSAAEPAPQIPEPIASISDVPEQHILTVAVNAYKLHQAIGRGHFSTYATASAGLACREAPQRPLWGHTSHSVMKERDSV